MFDSTGAGMLRGWIMLWNQELLWMLASLVVIAAMAAFAEGIAAIRAHRRWTEMAALYRVSHTKDRRVSSGTQTSVIPIRRP